MPFIFKIIFKICSLIPGDLSIVSVTDHFSVCFLLSPLTCKGLLLYYLGFDRFFPGSALLIFSSSEIHSFFCFHDGNSPPSLYNIPLNVFVSSGLVVMFYLTWWLFWLHLLLHHFLLVKFIHCFTSQQQFPFLSSLFIPPTSPLHPHPMPLLCFGTEKNRPLLDIDKAWHIKLK